MRTYLIIILHLVIIATSRSAIFFRRKFESGYMRGVDFYSTMRLISVMANAANQYNKVHGKYPNISNPTKFNEKIFYRKFFQLFKVPESGNKLLTSEFIPSSINNNISCPEIVWHSSLAILPENKEIPEGCYYLKANHGSSMFAKVKFPISSDEREYLEKKCNSWLSNDFGFWDGEWWYCVFDKEVILEKSVSKNEDSVAIGFYVFKGKIKFIILNRKTEDGDQITWLDEFFNLYKVQSEYYLRVQNVDINYNLDSLIDKVKEIAGERDFVRIDILIGDDRKHYLGEVTFSPGNALSVRPDDLEAYLGECWPIIND